MSHKLPNRRLRGFTLLELIVLLPMLLLVMSMTLWALRAQMSTHRRLANQADRHAVMRSVLNHLRHDFAEAGGFEYENPVCVPAQIPSDPKQVANQEVANLEVKNQDVKNPSQPVRLDVTTATIRLTTLAGVVTYHLHDNAPLCNKSGNTTQRIRVPRQTLVRIDPDGTSMKWLLRGQTLVIGPGDDVPARMLHISFETRLQSEGARESLRQYQTTLLTGGRQ